MTDIPIPDQQPHQSEAGGLRAMLRRWLGFVVLGLALYAGLYVLAERQVRASGEANRFFLIAATPPTTFDTVILGASHAMPLGYGGMQEVLEEASGTSILNLAIEGAGPVPNAFVLDAFLRRHQLRHLVYVVDSFAFLADDWNEKRLDDADLFRRAPLDSSLIATFIKHPATWPRLLEYLSGFAKINALWRLGPDRTDAELTKFDRTWRPIPQIDSQRIGYLFSVAEGAEAEARYLGELQAMITRVQADGARVTLLKVPTPPRYRDLLPDEPGFDARITALADATGADFVDHSALLPGDEFYYDTDHMNRAGVEAYAKDGLVALLAGATQ